jgi:hypothetical protein
VLRWPEIRRGTMAQCEIGFATSIVRNVVVRRLDPA